MVPVSVIVNVLLEVPLFFGRRGVVRRHNQRLTSLQTLIGRVSSIEAVCTIAVDCQTSHGTDLSERQNSIVIHIRRYKAACDRGVFIATVRASDRHRSIVGSSHSDLERLHDAGGNTTIEDAAAVVDGDAHDRYGGFTPTSGRW